MKLLQLHRDWRITLGLALFVLGAGNWIIGRQKTEQYSQLIAGESRSINDQTYRSFDDLDAGAGAVLKPFTDEQRRVSFATARMDFYHATFLAGQGLVAAGLLITFLGFIAQIRFDARRDANRSSLGIANRPRAG